jgi:hypothetical protein
LADEPPLVPAKAGTQLLDSRFRGNERSWTGVIENSVR